MILSAFQLCSFASTTLSRSQSICLSKTTCICLPFSFVSLPQQPSLNFHEFVCLSAFHLFLLAWTALPKSPWICLLFSFVSLRQQPSLDLRQSVFLSALSLSVNKPLWISFNLSASQLCLFASTTLLRSQSSCMPFSFVFLPQQPSLNLHESVCLSALSLCLNNPLQISVNPSAFQLCLFASTTLSKPPWIGLPFSFVSLPQQPSPDLSQSVCLSALSLCLNNPL